MTRSITKEEINALPHLQFEGKVVMINSAKSLDGAIDELSDHEIVGFDTEARPSFRKGEYHPTSLIQIAVDHKCFLIRSLATGITDRLVSFFQEPSVKKVGIALHDDIKDLQRIRNFQPQNFTDLNVVANNLGLENIGAKNLSAIFLHGKISKNQQTSNWENPTLTDAQQIYAATDAWICLKIFEEMLVHNPSLN